MNNDVNVVEISDGIDFINLPSERFKTAEISVSMAVPLREETAGTYALTAYLLSRSCERYPEFIKLNQKLASLYGASIGVSVSKFGENQIIKLGITAIDDRFCFDDCRVSKECVDLLLDMLFTPKLDIDGFVDADIEREKRLLTERLQSEQNEKRLYVLHRLEEEMFKNEHYHVNPLGSIDSIKKISKKEIMDSWVNLITTSKILVTVVGNVEHRIIVDKIEKTFSDIFRRYKPLEKPKLVKAASKVNTLTEKQNINQGKLVLGFRVDMSPQDDLTSAMATAVDIFGGGPYSRLFTNVREKLSLCYYCNARYIKAKSAVIVQCGCEEENMDKAVEEICKQLQAVAKGEFLQGEFDASKISIQDSIRSYNDNPATIEYYYILQMCEGKYVSPAQKALKCAEVTKQDVQECAGKISLDTVFKLVGENDKGAQ